MQVTLKGDSKKLAKFLKKESLWFKRNGIEVIQDSKATKEETLEEIKQPKKRGPKPKTDK